MDAQINKKNHTSSSSIHVLIDELLIEIFIRLPSYETVIGCKFVSKHWLNLLSNPKFIVVFLNHKNKNQTKKQQQLPWTFLSTMKMRVDNTMKENKESTNLFDSKNNSYNIIPTHEVFDSPKFALNFLRFPFKIVTTFKDLILCINPSCCDREHYFICNPVTKQWVTLPSCPTPSVDHDRSWATLVCQDVYYNDNQRQCGLRFRVVVVQYNLDWVSSTDHPFTLFDMMVFCSETLEWKLVKLSVTLRPVVAKQSPAMLRTPFTGLVCNGLVCVRYNAYFGMFNPFDVRPTTSNGATLEAKTLPIYTSGQMFECGGKLIRISKSDSMISNKDDKDLVQLSMTNFEFDVNKGDEAPHGWSRYFTGKCCDVNGSLPLTTIASEIIGMHPCNKELFYILTEKHEVVLCDMGLNSLKALGILPRNHSKLSARLELQYWPTPLPQMNHL